MKPRLAAVDKQEGWCCSRDMRNRRCLLPSLRNRIIKSTQPKYIGTVVVTFYCKVIHIGEIKQAIQVNHGLHITGKSSMSIVSFKFLVPVGCSYERSQLTSC